MLIYFSKLLYLVYNKKFGMCRIDGFSNIHATYSCFFFQSKNWDSQQRAETAAISNFEISSNLTIGAIKKLCGQDFHNFWLPTYLNVDIFYLKRGQKEAFFDHLPTSSRPRSFWTTTKMKLKNYEF